MTISVGSIPRPRAYKRLELSRRFFIYRAKITHRKENKIMKVCKNLKTINIKWSENDPELPTEVELPDCITIEDEILIKSTAKKLDLL